MTEESTLADFGADQSETADDEDPTPAAEPAESADSSTETGGSEPPTPVTTYGWGEYTCAACEGSCDSVWRDGDRLVCPTCKSW